MSCDWSIACATIARQIICSVIGEHYHESYTLSEFDLTFILLITTFVKIQYSVSKVVAYANNGVCSASTVESRLKTSINNRGWSDDTSPLPLTRP